jgi:hypothetical protein
LGHLTERIVRYLSVLLAGAVTVAVVAFALVFYGATLFPSLFLTGSPTEKRPSVPGWQDLILCSELVSMDGRKTLSLSEDHSVILHEEESAQGKDDKKGDRDVKGTWSYDQLYNEYSVSLVGTTTTYTIVNPEVANTCLFIKGTLESANLRESWFSWIDQDEVEQPPREP